jgi:hypothetical protein
MKRSFEAMTATTTAVNDRGLRRVGQYVLGM